VIRAVAAVLFAMVVSGPFAQAQNISEPPTADDGAQLVGLPIFTREGVKIGTVMEAGMDEGETVAVAVIRDKQGRTTRILIIPANLYVVKAGRLELLLTAAQLKTKLGSDRR
jgi:sporulation protein YlmC with PRC-barrel domain